MSVKNEVLSMLEKYKNENISGQELAKKLGVSRSAVWKAIKSLQEEGHKIYATTNKGYRLDINSDIISCEGVRNFLSCENRNYPIIYYKSIDSSNTEAKRLVLGGAKNGTIIIADEQTAGRGRMGKSFFSPPNTGIYMSIILRPVADINGSQLVTIYTAVSVCKVIERLLGVSPKIKWVNDIFLNGKKICGILTEANGDFESKNIESIVIGIGLNCSTKEDYFPEEIRNIAGSLLANNISRNELIAGIIDELFSHGDCKFDSNLIDEYKSRSFMINKEIVYNKNNRMMTGTVLDINEKGNLVVKTNDNSVDILSSGEVSIRSQIYD